MFSTVVWNGTKKGVDILSICSDTSINWWSSLPLIDNAICSNSMLYKAAVVEFRPDHCNIKYFKETEWPKGSSGEH